MKELFEKVIIDGKQENLPPNSGIYIVFVKDDNEINQWKYDPFPEDKCDWLKNIDWYLLPKEPTILDKFIESMTEEDIQRLMEPKVVSDTEIRKHLIDIYKPIFHERKDLNRHFRKCAFKEMKWMRKQLTGE
jgi:hypothetical protein